MGTDGGVVTRKDIPDAKALPGASGPVASLHGPGSEVEPPSGGWTTRLDFAELEAARERIAELEGEIERALCLTPSSVQLGHPSWDEAEPAVEPPDMTPLMLALTRWARLQEAQSTAARESTPKHASAGAQAPSRAAVTQSERDLLRAWREASDE